MCRPGLEFNFFEVTPMGTVTLTYLNERQSRKGVDHNSMKQTSYLALGVHICEVVILSLMKLYCELS